ncbi:MAG: histidine phosphatase family protein [Microgenomates group bacterium]
MSNKLQQHCRFYFTRHGQTIWNIQKKMQGHKDSPLTEEGVEQAKTLSEKLRSIPFSSAYSSDLERANHTAKIIIEPHGLPVEVTPLLRESRLGPYEGKALNTFLTDLKLAIKRRENLDHQTQMTFKIHPEIESFQEQSVRMIQFFSETAPKYPGKDVLVVSHSGIMRSTLITLGFAKSSELPIGAIKNASYVVIESDGQGHRVVRSEGIDRN